MSYQSIHTGITIDDNISTIPNIKNNINTIQNKLNTIEEGANKLVNNCIKTAYLQNESVTVEKLAPEVADSLASIKLYYGTLFGSEWTDSLAASENLSSMQNKWKWELFGSSYTMDSSIRQVLSNIAPSLTRYYNDSSVTSTNIAYGDNYIARCTTYVYCNADIDYEAKIKTDDDSCTFLNGVFIINNPNTTETSAILPFKKGANCLEVFYHEKTGDDGWQITPKISSVITTSSVITSMYAVPAHTYTQTITPICLDGNSKINSSFIFTPGMCLTSDLTTAADRDRINTGVVIGNEDGTITIKYNHMIPVTNDITMYWFGKDTA